MSVPCGQPNPVLLSMRIKVEDTWYDAENMPICVELTQADKENIANMAPEATRYSAFPEDFPIDLMREWIKK